VNRGNAMAKRPPQQSNSEAKPSDNPTDGLGKSHQAPTVKKRLDVLIFERGLAESRQKAQAMLLAGTVRVNGQAAGKAGTATATDAAIEIVGDGLKYVGRGGLKLEGALEDLGVSAAGKICLDAGSSTGGFTDCLLQNGAKRVFAVDVNIQQLDWKLQRDARVVRVEKNARYLLPEDIADAPELIVADVSFISVAKILPALIGVAKAGAIFLILVKPQFELERGEIGKGGIVRDPQLHQKAIERVREAAIAAGLEILGVRASRLAGAEGNQEFFLHARLGA
jgi:23S rRNA (cytidine1920-2'-O)/16S rRNA (cytidine1409-2'-O)-methyltransferase